MPSGMQAIARQTYLEIYLSFQQGLFNLGIYTSASLRTVNIVKDMLEAAAGPGPPLFGEQRLILYRVHTLAAPKDHILGGGKEWDTIKPLTRYFSKLHRVLLVDDDAFKVSSGCFVLAPSRSLVMPLPKSLDISLTDFWWRCITNLDAGEDEKHWP